jgi:hypothetical protein
VRALTYLQRQQSLIAESSDRSLLGLVVQTRSKVLHDNIHDILRWQSQIAVMTLSLAVVSMGQLENSTSSSSWPVSIGRRLDELTASNSSVTCCNLVGAFVAMSPGCFDSPYFPCPGLCAESLSNS